MKPIHVMAELAMTTLLIAACTKNAAEVPKRWANLHLPTDGLKQVLPATNEHGYYADHSGADATALWAKVSTALRAAGYAPVCNVLDGHVRGFAKGDDKLTAKIDTFGNVLSLSIFDEQGKDPLLHGVCFGKYKLGPGKKIK